MKKLVTLVIRNAPTTAMSEVMSSSMMSTNFMCSERNTAKPPFCPDGEDHSVE